MVVDVLCVVGLVVCEFGVEWIMLFLFDVLM